MVQPENNTVTMAASIVCRRRVTNSRLNCAPSEQTDDDLGHDEQHVGHATLYTPSRRAARRRAERPGTTRWESGYASNAPPTTAVIARSPIDAHVSRSVWVMGERFRCRRNDHQERRRRHGERDAHCLRNRDRSIVPP